MTKIELCLVALLLVTVSAVHNLENAKSILRQDTCATDSMALIQPEIDEVAARLRENPQDLKAKTELLALVEKTRQIYEKCNLNNKVEPVLGDAVEAAGVGFLLGSNCFKDVGIVLLLGDSIIQDPTDWTNDTIVVIFLYLLGRQGYADCAKFIGFVL